MQRKKILQIAMRLTESIVEILKEEFEDDKKKVKDRNARKHKEVVKRSR